MRNIKLTIEYDGTNFNGWQTQAARNKQAVSKTQRTVQGEIEKVLRKIFKQSLKLIGSGRTDSGVHALGQVANFETRSVMPVEKMRRALNANLPEDIAIIKTEEIPLNFHARYSVKSKVYRYTILNRKARCAQQRNFSLLYPYKLNLRDMREEAKSLIGRHDFRSFTASDPAKRKKGIEENTVRTIKRLTITKKGDLLTLDIEANGFLYKMVRNIVGTLLEIGSGKRAKQSIKRILAKKDRNTAGITAKPNGLTLLEVKY
ncbi:MAG: tRNA pseudouridine(38-40) synthase TruA [Candidatus Omnitrophica bacterium]|nr:tRNA pseudouridine(38-40) synthase TruA [Candidatus Omnitrophota bacterium]